jgi:uncharacterized membrane protein YphA (DoxX/SURF4 family)
MYHIIRVGLGITFLWIGVLIFRNPESWSGYLLPWAAGILPVPLTQAMLGTAFLDIVVGFFLLVDLYTWIAAAFATLHLLLVLATSGITDITVRDIGLLAAAFALLIESLPAQYQFWRKK